MRLCFLLLVAVLAGCPGSTNEQADLGDGAGSGSGGGAGGGLPSNECQRASDCVPAGPKCCDCPTHAVPKTDPAHQACESVNCPTPTCGSPTEAACRGGQCVLVCSAVTCEANVSCTYGFATDDNGCLTCECSAPSSTECSLDGDCARVRDDCCGCMMGGSETAILASQVAAHEAQLMCPQNPSCPMVNTCAADLAARCIAGTCLLVSGALPQNACGRPDLPACPAGERCTVNASDPATMQGVGVCQPAP